MPIIQDYPILSVIITCHNSEYYLQSAIESIRQQSLENIEIVVVNDASNGNFIAIQEKYKSDPQIVFIHNPENMGLFYSRLAGFKHSKGEYIAFCDADDMASFDFYRKLLDLAVRKEADMAIGDVALYEHDVTEKDRENAELLSKYMNQDILLNENLDLNGDDIFEFFMSQAGACYTLHVVWNKIYKRELFANCFKEYVDFLLQAHKITTCEDIAFSHLLWLKAKKVVNAHNIFYFYRRHDASETMRKRQKNDFLEDLRQLKAVFAFFKNNLVKYDLYERFQKNFQDWQALYCRYWWAHALKYDFAKSVKEELKQTFDQSRLDTPTRYDNYYLSLQTNLGKPFVVYEAIKRTICDKDIDIVSFDVFDTLIMRPLAKPDDVFHLMTQKANKILGNGQYLDFHQIRTEAEKECRAFMAMQSPREDITIDDIYKYMGKMFVINEDALEKLKKLELETERHMALPRKLGKELYDLAVYKGKRIICISDMYLPGEFIETLLLQNGYDRHARLYVSSDCGLLKSTGNLYRYVAKKENIFYMPAWLHIGDNLQTDIQVASELKIWSGYLPNVQAAIFGNLNGFYTGSLLNTISSSNLGKFNLHLGLAGFCGLRAMIGLAAAKLFDENVVAFNEDTDTNASPAYIGYFLLGMHLYALTDWLLKEKPRNGTIHFAGRDGYLPMQAARIMDPQAAVNYFHITRKSILPLLIGMNAHPLALSTFIRWDNITPAILWEPLAHILKTKSIEEFSAQIAAAGFPLYKKFLNLSQFVSFVAFLKTELVDQNILSIYMTKIKKEFAAKFKEGDLLFDIGYSGRTEELLANLLARTIASCYVHINNDRYHHRKSLHHFGSNIFYSHIPQMYCPLREMFFSECGPSCIGYNVDSNTIEPIFEDYKPNQKSKRLFKQIHMHALQFIKDFGNIFQNYKTSLYFSTDYASAPFEHFLHFPKPGDIEPFSNTIFEDDLFGGRSLNIVDEWQMVKQNWQQFDPGLSNPTNCVRDTAIEKLTAECENLRQQLIKYKENENNSDKNDLQGKLDNRWLKLVSLYEQLKQFKKVAPQDIYKDYETNGNLNCPPPPDFDEEAYLRNYPDIRQAIEKGQFPSAFAHYMLHGKAEGRKRK